MSCDLLVRGKTMGLKRRSLMSFRHLVAGITLCSAICGADPGYAAQTASLPAPVAQRSPAAPDYVVGANDALTISVFDQPQLTGRYIVQADGTFTFPLLGRLQV